MNFAEKPFVLNFIEMKKNLIDTINNAVRAGVPFVTIEAVMTDLMGQVNRAAQNEADEAVRSYSEEVEKQLKEERPNIEDDSVTLYDSEDNKKSVEKRVKKEKATSVTSKGDNK